MLRTLRDNLGHGSEVHELHRSADLVTTLNKARDAGVGIVPAGALTSAVGAFRRLQNLAEASGLAGVWGIQPKAVIEGQIEGTLSEIPLVHQYRMNKEKGTITVGAGLTVDQINHILRCELPEGNYAVLQDLTTRSSATIGGVFATGAMGPNRMQLGNVLESVYFHNGEGVQLLVGENAIQHQSLLGLTGMAAALELRYTKLAENRFLLTVPVMGKLSEGAADLISSIHQYTQRGEDLWLDGIELMGRETLEYIALHHEVEAIRNKAKQYAVLLMENQSQYILMLSGYSEMHPYDSLEALMDAPALWDHSDIPDSFDGQNLLFNLREGGPDLTRRFGQNTSNRFTLSTDANVPCYFPGIDNPHFSPDAVRRVLSLYDTYKGGITAIQEQFGTDVQLCLGEYGHLNPQGLDPHFRVVIASEKPESLEQAKAQIQMLHGGLMGQILGATRDLGISVIGGEKGIKTGIELGKIANDDAPVHAIVRDAHAIVNSATLSFNFRAPTIGFK